MGWDGMGALGLRELGGGLFIYVCMRACVRAKCSRLHSLNVLLTTVVKEGSNHSTELTPRSE